MQSRVGLVHRACWTRCFVSGCASTFIFCFAWIGQVLAAPPAISWELENPFRSFLKAEVTQKHRRYYEQVKKQTPASAMSSPVRSVEWKFAESYGHGWAKHLLYERETGLSNAVHQPTCWSKPKGDSDCGAFIVPKSHAVLVWVEGLHKPCTWSTDGRQTQSSTDCSYKTRLYVPYPGGAEVSVQVQGGATAKQHIVVKDLLILGLGDSFASGEGNPDVPVEFDPSEELNYDSDTLKGYPIRMGVKSLTGIDQLSDDFHARGARWLHQSCHRSVYSHQFRVALQLAIENPQRSVTFAGFACTGAEIGEGLLSPWSGRDEPSLKAKATPGVFGNAELAQLSAASRAVCKPGTAKLGTNDYNRDELFGEGRMMLLACTKEELRRPVDLVLLSVGGNDVGFSGLVAKAAMQDDALVIPKLFGASPQVSLKEAKQKISLLYDGNSQKQLKYGRLAKALSDTLHLQDPRAVLLTAYPQMSLSKDGNGKLKTCPDGQRFMDVTDGWYARRARAQEVEQLIAGTLTPTMKAAADKFGWTFVERHRTDERFVGHAFCSLGQQDESDPAYSNSRFPRHVGAAPSNPFGVDLTARPPELNWGPFHPDRFEPYLNRTRWFRTPNDAFLTANSHDELDTVSSLNTLLQVTSWTAYSGAFHPTAMGQAAIADAVLIDARAILGR